MLPALSVQVQGQGTVSADNLNTYQQTCNTFNDLRAFVGISGIQVYARGASAIGDGGQGLFYWNAGLTNPVDNNSTVIVPFGASSGAWVRITGAEVEIVSCAASGTNTLALTPLTSADSVSSYTNYTLFSWVQPNTTTGAVTAAFNPGSGALGSLNVYLAGGTVQAGTGASNTQLQAGQLVIAAYSSQLDGALGGLVIVSGMPNINPPIASVVDLLFATSGSYTPSTSLVTAEMYIQGGHGGGGGVLPSTTGSVATAGGGGAGALLTFAIAAATLGTGAMVVTVGAGGVPGSAAGTSGGSGGATSVGSFTAGGGGGGAGSTNSGGHDLQPGGSPGGSTAGPAMSIGALGSSGGFGFASSAANAGGVSGYGAPAPMWGGIAPGIPVTSGGATAGANGGSGSGINNGGGSGACAAGTTAGAIGGSGGSGFVLIREYRHG